MQKSEAYESLEAMAKYMYYSEDREYSDEELERGSLGTVIDMQTVQSRQSEHSHSCAYLT